MSSTITIEFSNKLTKLSEIDKHRLRLGILKWIFGEINKPSEWEIAKRANAWKIIIHESSESKLDEYKALVSAGDQLSAGIPHGITRKTIKQVDVFIPNVGGILGLRQAFDAISHEIGHMVLSILVDLGVLPARSIRRMQDKTNKPRSEGNTETVEVHDRINEIKAGKRQPMKFHVSKYKIDGVEIGGFELVGIDIKDLINKAAPA